MRIGRSGAVREPASGAFDVTVAPGEDVQAAVDACPPGGCVLLRPGTHAGPMKLAADKVVHVFGRGRAILRAAVKSVLKSEAAVSTADRLIIRREVGGDIHESAVSILEGGLRLQACDIVSAVFYCVLILSDADPVLAKCKCVGVVAA